MERLPSGRLIAIDRSWNMLMTARANLRPVLGSRVSFVQVSLPDLPFAGWADLVFSTATFHWVKDHPALFAGIFEGVAIRRPAARAVRRRAQPAPRARARRAGDALRCRSRGSSATGRDPGNSRTRKSPPTRLKEAGFVDIDTSLEEAPTTLATEADYREFVTTVIYHPHLERLPEAALKQAFIDRVTELAAKEPVPFTLDYWRLNMSAQKP